jgi:hypothetical protein
MGVSQGTLTGLVKKPLREAFKAKQNTKAIMAKFSKLSLLMLLLILAAPSIQIIELTSADAIPTPSVPEFSLQLNDQSYDVPSTTTTTTDPYTGEQTVTTQPGYHVLNGTIEILVNHQVFTRHYDSDNRYIQLFLRIAYKGHFATSWKYYPGDFEGNSQYLLASKFGSTNFRFGLGKDLFGGEDRTIFTLPTIGGGAAGGEVDFKVEAFIGYREKCEYTALSGLSTYDVYTGESSGWSNTQTITIPTNQTASTPTTEPSQSTTTPTASPQEATATPAPLGAETGVLFGLNWEKIVIIVLVGVVAVMAVSMLLIWRKISTK